MAKLQILVIDDEISVQKLLRRFLESKGYAVVSAMNGAEGLQAFETKQPSLVILDIMMPEMNGFEVCRRLREWSQVPIVMLSANSDETDKVQCLNIGADDYVTKPFGTGELLARLQAVLRRTTVNAISPVQPSYSCGNFEMSFTQRRVMIGGKEVKLTPTEFALLQEFVLNAKKVLTHAHLLHKIWGPEYREEKEYLHVFVNRLRNKIEPDTTNPSYIITISGVGYQFSGTP